GASRRRGGRGRAGLLRRLRARGGGQLQPPVRRGAAHRGRLARLRPGPGRLVDPLALLDPHASIEAGRWPHPRRARRRRRRRSERPLLPLLAGLSGSPLRAGGTSGLRPPGPPPAAATQPLLRRLPPPPPATQPRTRPPTPHIGRHAGRADAGTARPPPPAGRQRPLTAGTLARRLPYQPPSRRLLGRARLPRRLRGGLRLLRLCRARLQPRGTGTARERLLRRLRRLPGRALL